MKRIWIRALLIVAFLILMAGCVFAFALTPMHFDWLI